MVDQAWYALLIGPSGTTAEQRRRMAGPFALNAGRRTAAKPIGIAAAGDADRLVQVDRRVMASAISRAMDEVGWSYAAG